MADPTKNDTILTVFEVATLLKTTPRTVRQWKQSHNLPYFRAGSQLRFFLSDVLAWCGIPQPEAPESPSGDPEGPGDLPF